MLVLGTPLEVCPFLYMPRPGKNEKRKDFIKRCIPIVLEDGTAKDSDQAVAICNSIWRERKKMKETEIKEEAVLEGVAILEKATEEKPNGKDKKHIVYIVPYGAVSFEDVEEYTKSQIVGDRIQELTRIYQDLIWNIMFNDEIEDKTSAMTALTKEFNSRVNSTIEESASIGIVGNVVQFFKDLAPKRKEPEEGGIDNGFHVWLEKDRYRWLSLYTNKYRDDDVPPEILSEAAHEQFVKEVEAGIHPYPELWHWHTPGTRWGIADLLHYDKDTGIMLASGLVDEGHEKEAEAMIAMDEPIKASHGMPPEFIKREGEDKTIITNYVSREISDLPARYAANQLATFEAEEVKEKMIPEDKKSYLRKAGLTDERISAVEVAMDGKAKQAEVEKLEFKKKKEAEEVVEPTETPEVEEPGVEAAPVTREEVAEAIVETVQPIAEAVTAIAESIGELKKSDETKIAETVQNIPAASIGAIIARNFSAIGAKKAKVDGRTKESKDGPEETEATAPLTHIGFIDKMLTEE